jgi:hypothetical protein
MNGFMNPAPEPMVVATNRHTRDQGGRRGKDAGPWTVPSSKQTRARAAPISAQSSPVCVAGATAHDGCGTGPLPTAARLVTRGSYGGLHW